MQEDTQKDVRITQHASDKRIIPETELSDSEDEKGDGRRDRQSYREKRKTPEKKTMGENAHEKVNIDDDNDKMEVDDVKLTPEEETKINQLNEQL